MSSSVGELNFGNSYVMNLFITLNIFVLLMTCIDLVAGFIPMCIRFEGKRLSAKIGYINCLCGGFLMASVMEMLYESNNVLTLIYGPFQHAFMLFCLGYVTMMFSERWVHAITAEPPKLDGYELHDFMPHDTEGDLMLLRERNELVRPNNTTANVLVLVCVIEGFFSSFAAGVQPNLSALINMTLMLLFSEWIQMFIFSFKFQQCKSGVLLDNITPMISSNSDVIVGRPSQHDDFYFQESTRQRRTEVRRQTAVAILVVTLANAFGAYIGFFVSHATLFHSAWVQQTVASTALAFVSGVFWYIAAHQMVYEELDKCGRQPGALLKHTLLALLGLFASALLNVVMFYYLQ